MCQKAEVVSVNVSEGKGTVKHPVEEIHLDANGIVGDAHAAAWHRQVSLLSAESVDAFSSKLGRAIAPGEFAENITLRGIDLGQVAVLDRFRIGSVELEVTQIGKTCHGDSCAIFREVGQCIMPKEGLFSRVLHPGPIRPGDAVDYLPRNLSFTIITLSDRAARGDYPDKSGPRVKKGIEAFLAGKRWHPEFETLVIPDDADRLSAELSRTLQAGVDVIFTTGGTGVGPRDITPETAAGFIKKTIPGIMESIRIKSGARHPRALLSRGIAGVAGRTLIFTLPGSVRAVEEYLEEITPNLEHLIYMLHGLDIH